MGAFEIFEISLMALFCRGGRDTFCSMNDKCCAIGKKRRCLEFQTDILTSFTWKIHTWLTQHVNKYDLIIQNLLLSIVESVGTQLEFFKLTLSMFTIFVSP